jgi:multimeric flavodoxin WrbA
MKITLINGSPKTTGSVSELVITALRERIGEAAQCQTCHALQAGEVLHAALQASDAIVFVFPLYVDAIPSHLLRLMEDLSSEIATLAPGAVVYAISQNGFYEGHQNALALEMVRSFCVRSGLTWGGGLGVGAGGMTEIAPIGNGPMANLGKALDALAQAITSGSSADDSFIEPNFPRFLYKGAADLNFRLAGRKSRLSPKQLRQTLP